MPIPSNNNIYLQPLIVAAVLRDLLLIAGPGLLEPLTDALHFHTLWEAKIVVAKQCIKEEMRMDCFVVGICILLSSFKSLRL